MADEKTTRYMELQMQELKDALGTEELEVTPKKNINDKARNEKNAEIAKLYEDAAEYEEDLLCFEEELEIVKANELKNIASLLIQKFPNEERNYAQELKAILEASWTHFVEVTRTHPKEQLELIKEIAFCDAVERLNAMYPEHTGDFETEIKNILVKRWETIIAIKKEHVKEEFSYIKTLGLKPTYAKRIYKQFHGIE